MGTRPHLRPVRGARRRHSGFAQVLARCTSARDEIAIITIEPGVGEAGRPLAYVRRSNFSGSTRYSDSSSITPENYVKPWRSSARGLSLQPDDQPGLAENDDKQDAEETERQRRHTGAQNRVGLVNIDVACDVPAIDDVSNRGPVLSRSWAQPHR